jgi:succinate dehydrogenase iron-sulfur subunit
VNVTVRIKRFNPELDRRPEFKEYSVDVEPMDRVLDALNKIKWFKDGTLTYRRSCAHGICGSDAMRINGRNRLACKVLMREVGDRVTIDMGKFFDAYRSIKPYLITDSPPPNRERLQSPAERQRYDDTTKCILCAACTTACPITWTNDEFVGPAAIVNAHRFILDSRDRGGRERLRILNARFGVWRCRTIFNCTDACPREIEVTKAIEEVKRILITEDF